jgi:hypothetical protein
VVVSSSPTSTTSNHHGVVERRGVDGRIEIDFDVRGDKGLPVIVVEHVGEEREFSEQEEYMFGGGLRMRAGTGMPRTAMPRTAMPPV